jgi:methyl halide transferase
METILDQAYWENRYQNNLTQWDVGYITTPLKEYFDKLTDKNIQILIPGAGNSYEAIYLYENGFKNITVMDIAAPPLENLKSKAPSFPKDHILQENFFDHNGQYDLIVEQTFFCALEPALRIPYLQKMSALLKPAGKLVGLLFETEFDTAPPFGGTKAEYVELFSRYFNLQTFERCYNSIPARQGRELFISVGNK